MILRFVERRSDPDAVMESWLPSGGRHELLTALAGPLGRPDWTVDVVLIDDESMAALNAEFRQAAGVTDVLSFSYLQKTGPGDPDLPKGRGHAYENLWLDTLEPDRENEAGQAVGEVILAAGFVADRCRDRGWALEHEIPLLVVHGMLHLLGWQHDSEVEFETMKTVEEGILSGAGLPHPLRERS